MTSLRLRSRVEPWHIWLAFVAGVATIPFAYLLAKGISDDAVGYAVGGILGLAAIAMIVLYLAVGRRISDDEEATVGNLSDVLANLGAEIRGANEKARDRDTIRWVNGELTISVAVEANASGGFDFKVVNGQVAGKLTHATTIKMNLWPADPTVETLGGL